MIYDLWLLACPTARKPFLLPIDDQQLSAMIKPEDSEVGIRAIDYCL